MINRLLGLFINLRFKQKLILSYIVITIIPIIVLGGYSYEQSKRFIQKQVMSGMKDTVNTMADSMNDKIGKYNNMTDLIVFNSSIQRIFTNRYSDLANLSYDLRDHLEPLFQTILYLNKEITNLTVYTQTMPEYGSMIQSYERVKDTSWYKASHDSLIPVWAYDQGELFLTRRFSDYYVNHNFVLLTMKFNYGGLFGHLDSDMPEYGIVVADEQGDILFSQKTSHADEPELRAIDAQIAKEGIAKWNGAESFVVKREVPQSRWTIYYYAPVPYVSPGAGTIVGATVVIVLLCIAVLMLLIWLFSRTFLKQIVALNRNMRLVAQGNFTIDIRSSSRDEIGELTNRFGIMVKQINELIQEAYHNKLLQKEAELSILQSQINPHFLYNTLSVINWKALHLGAADISHVVTTLSRFYRTALNKGERMTPIRSELENTKCYVEIQLVMHDRNFDVDYAIDERLYEYWTLNFILQPIVENAILHGIDHKAEGRGSLTIKGLLMEKHVEFAVEDNGPGISEEISSRLLTAASNGYGLKNVNDRIKLAFGDAYGIDIDSEEGRGTIITLRLPVEKRNS